MAEHIIITCTKCRLSFDMDFEPSLDDLHTGPDGDCLAEDEDWLIEVTPCGDPCRIHSRTKPERMDFTVDITAKETD